MAYLNKILVLGTWLAGHFGVKYVLARSKSWCVVQANRVLPGKPSSAYNTGYLSSRSWMARKFKLPVALGLLGSVAFQWQLFGEVPILIVHWMIKCGINLLKKTVHSFSWSFMSAAGFCKLSSVEGVASAPRKIIDKIKLQNYDWVKLQTEVVLPFKLRLFKCSFKEKSYEPLFYCENIGNLWWMFKILGRPTIYLYLLLTGVILKCNWYIPSPIMHGRSSGVGENTESKKLYTGNPSWFSS